MRPSDAIRRLLCPHRAVLLHVYETARGRFSFWWCPRCGRTWTRREKS